MLTPSIARGCAHLPMVSNSSNSISCITGKKELPSVKTIVEKFLLRRQFIPDPQGSNIMFAFFAQHFTHQFFKTDVKRGAAFTKALGHGVRA